MFCLPDRQAVVVDIETTEASLSELRGGFPDPVEIGAVKIDSEFSVLDRFSCFVQPQHFSEFDEFCEELTGISSADLEQAKTWRECWKDFADFTSYQGLRLLSWNSSFDYGVLRQVYANSGITYPHRHPFICALSVVYGLAGIYGYRARNWSLKDVCERFGILP